MTTTTNLEYDVNFLRSEEGKKLIKEFVDKIEKERKILDFQLERFHLFCNKSVDNFSIFVDKVLAKYGSSEYINFWYGKGIEPPQDLTFFLFRYAEKYGRECLPEEFKKYGNAFTFEMFYINGYYFNWMNGQGSCVKIMQEN